jgi:hypothetical protein
MGFIDDRWNNILHHPLHITGAFLYPTLFHSGDFDYYGTAMAIFFSYVQRIVPDPRAHVAIQVLEMYKRVVRLFGYDIVVEGRTIVMPKNHFVANFIFVRFNVQIKISLI